MAGDGAAPTMPRMPGTSLGEAIPGMPDTTLLLLSDGPLNANNPLLRAIRPVCNVEEVAAPRGEQLARWIKETAEAKGAAIAPAAIRSMADLVGSDLWTLDQELEKLSLYATGREIVEQDVSLMVSQVREASIFEAVDAMIDGRSQVALRLLAQLRDDGRETAVHHRHGGTAAAVACSGSRLHRAAPPPRTNSNGRWAHRRTSWCARQWTRPGGTPGGTSPGVMTAFWRPICPSSRAGSTLISPSNCWSAIQPHGVSIPAETGAKPQHFVQLSPLRLETTPGSANPRACSHPVRVYGRYSWGTMGL